MRVDNPKNLFFVFLHLCGLKIFKKINFFVSWLIISFHDFSIEVCRWTGCCWKI